MILPRNAGVGMSDLKTRVAGWIRSSRINRGMTQEELADRIGLSVQSVSAIENAKNLPALDTMVTLAEVLGLDLTEALGKHPLRPGELKVRSFVQRLDDDTLGLAVRQIETLVEHSERMARKRKSQPT